MRKPYALTAVLMVTVATFTYACGDDDEVVDPQESAEDAGRDAAPKTDAGGDDEPEDSGGDVGKDSGSDSGDAGDGGDAEDTRPKVMVVRDGELDGGMLGLNTAPVFIDEYELETNTRVRTIALPTAANGNQRALVHTGPPSSTTHEGALSLSADGESVAVTGYSAYTEDAPPFTLPNATNPRVVARVKADGSVDTTTLVTNSFAPTNIGGGVISGNDVWITGTTDGADDGPLQYIAFGNALGGATDGTPIVAPNAPRYVVRIFQGQLYASAMSGDIFRVGAGLPTTANQTETSVVNAFGAFEFEFVDMDGAPGAERLYVAVDGAGPPGGVWKYTYDTTSSQWSLDTTFSKGVTTGVRGLAAYKDGTKVVIVASTTEGDKLLRFVDDGSADPASTVVATAAPGTFFSGVSVSPKP